MTNKAIVIATAGVLVLCVGMLNYNPFENDIVRHLGWTQPKKSGDPLEYDPFIKEQKAGHWKPLGYDPFEKNPIGFMLSCERPRREEPTVFPTGNIDYFSGRENRFKVEDAWPRRSPNLMSNDNDFSDSSARKRWKMANDDDDNSVFQQNMRRPPGQIPSAADNMKKPPMIDPSTGKVYPPAPDGGVIDPQTGKHFPSAGPHGVIDPETGKYYPR